MSTEQEIIADEARFIDFPSVTEDAAIVVEKTRKLFSLQRYSAEGRKLEVTWAPVEDFRAWAAARPGEPPTDQIGISYGAAWEIYRDAFVLPQFCEKHFATERYAQVYGPMQFGGGSARVLPEGLTAETAKVRIMNATLAWLYLHEQSHLFQNHGLIGRSLGASWASDDYLIDEMRDRRGTVISGKSAAQSHVFELAADHEAVNNVVGLILKANSDTLPAASIWCLVVGLTCMFQRFYGADDRTYTDEVTGTHPDPSFRLRVLLREMTLMIMQADVRKYATWIGHANNLQAVMDHAVITATMYCHIRYRTGQGVSAFLAGTQGYTEVPNGYRDALFEAWTEARPLVLKDYWGWGRECVLNLPTPAHLS